MDNRIATKLIKDGKFTFDDIVNDKEYVMETYIYKEYESLFKLKDAIDNFKEEMDKATDDFQGKLTKEIFNMVKQKLNEELDKNDMGY